MWQLRTVLTHSRFRKVGKCPGNETYRITDAQWYLDSFTIPYVLSTKLDKEVVPLAQFADGNTAKSHVAPNARILRLMNIADPLERSGYARLTLFPAITQKLYPDEFQHAHELGLV